MTISNNASALRPGVCTSSTRPTTPYEGQVIYETDTDKLLAWNGSSWNPPWNTAWGLMGNANVTSSQLGISTITDMTGMTVTFTAVANRQYMMMCTLAPYGTASEFADITLSVGATSSARVFRKYFPLTNVVDTVTYQHQFTTSAGSCTVKLRMTKGSTNNVSNYADGSFISNICVHDMGPV